MMFLDVQFYVLNCFNISVQKCVELISRSKRPVILIGSQSTLPPTPVDNLASELKVRKCFCC